MAGRQTKRDKEVDGRINKAYMEVSKGVSINILDISKIFRVGRESIYAGDDDETLRTKIRDFVQTIRLN